ncbi:MFS general substrate transporter [Setomelanomma holmii]|uniref:MFS general substrate transporter n=1 Tax=Setomelanomma holmii TaxID=210430 RepID=A0A9P4H6H0_9PLEO|nr:MFS general substrate transporter [Setomelanomma holmii]
MDRIVKDDKVELQDSDAWEVLGYSFPTWRKWQILIVVFFIQISINTNASMYSHAAAGVHKQYGVSEQVARIPQMAFLIAYAFANNFATYVVCRTLGGLSTAGGSVTLGVLADMWEPDEQEFAVAFLVLSSVGGSVVGAIIGAFVEEHLPLPWIFWIQLIIGGFVQFVHLVCIPETRSTILLDREAKRRRKTGKDPNVYGPNEIRGGHKITLKEIRTIFWRPFYMFFTEPIVLWLSLLSGFSDALIFTFLEGFKPVYSQWEFGTVGIGLAFIPILIGYILAYLSYMPSINTFPQIWWLLFLAPLLTIGLFGFAWTSLGPTHGVPWIAPMIFSTIIAMANYAIYQSSIDYKTAAYGLYAASATGGNDLARDFLAGVAAMYSTPLYKNIPGRPVQYASTILASLAFVVTIPIYVVYKKGPEIRAKSKFAQSLDKRFSERKEKRRKSSVVGLETGSGEKERKQHREHV